MVIQDSPDPIIISDSPAAKTLNSLNNTSLPSVEAQLPQTASKKSERKLAGISTLACSPKAKELSSHEKTKSPLCNGTKSCANSEESNSFVLESEESVPSSNVQGLFSLQRNGSAIGGNSCTSNGGVKACRSASLLGKDNKKSLSRLNQEGENNGALCQTIGGSGPKAFESCTASELKDDRKDGTSAENAIYLADSCADNQFGDTEGIDSFCDEPEKVHLCVDIKK